MQKCENGQNPKFTNGKNAKNVKKQKQKCEKCDLGNLGFWDLSIYECRDTGIYGYRDLWI